MPLRDSISSFRDGLDKWLSIWLKIIAIGAIALASVWFVISIFANIFEDNGGIEGEPSVKKAQYEIKLMTTGQIFLTGELDITATENYDIYTLHGYYLVDGDRWRYREGDLQLNERYFGQIRYQERE